MAIISFRKKTIFVETESTYGTDPTPTGADQVETFNLTIAPYDGPTVEKVVDREMLGGYQEINVAPRVVVTFDVYLAASGDAATTPPNWSKVLLACGFDETIASDVEYGPVSSSFGSCAIYFEHDGDQHIVLGTRGTVSVTFNANELPRMTFTMTGRYAAPTTATTSTPTLSNVGQAIPVTFGSTTTATVHGEAEALVSLNVDMQNNVAVENIPNLNEIFINDRTPRGTVVFLERQISDFDWYARIRSDLSVTLGALAIVHGTAAGDIIELDAPSVQLSNPRKGDRNGNATLTCDAKFLPSSGDDEFTITTK